MNVSIEDVSSVEKKLSITIPQDRVKQELNRAYSNLQREVVIRGFRRGKVPRRILESRFRSQVEGEVSSRLISDTLEQTIDEKGFFMVTRPTVEPGPLTGEDFTYVATIELKPEIAPTGYKGLELSKDVYDIDEDEVSKRIEEQRQKAGNLEAVEEDRGLAEGDVALINYTLHADGEHIEGPIENFQLELRADAMLPGFVDAITGLKRTEEREFELEAPESTPQPQLAGKKLQFQVVLNEIKVMVLPELDDEFAKDLEFDSLDALKENHRSEMREHLEETSRGKLHGEIVDSLIESNSVDMPSGLVKLQTDRLIQQQIQTFQQQGLGEQAAAIVEAGRENLEKQAVKQLQTALLLEAIAKVEKLEVSEDDIKARFDKMAKQSGQSAESLKGMYMKNNAMDNLKENILQDLTLGWIATNSTVTEVAKAYSEHLEGHDHDHGEEVHDHAHGGEAEHVHGEDCDHDHG